MTTVKERGKKLVSVMLSVLLAALLLPAYSPAVAHAAESTPTLTFTANWFEGEEDEVNSFTQEKPLEAIFASTDSKVVKPSVKAYTYGTGADDNAQLTEAIDEFVSDNNGDKGSVKDVELEWQSFDEADNPTTADDQVLTVIKGDNGSWKFVALGATGASGVDVKANITKATVKATFKYTVTTTVDNGDGTNSGSDQGDNGEAADAADEGEGSGGADQTPSGPTTNVENKDGSVEVALSGINAEASYPVVIEDAFEADKAAIASKFNNNEYTLTYGGESESEEVENLLYDSYTVKVEDYNQDFFDAAVEVKGNAVGVTVTPKRATDEQQTATLKISAKGKDGQDPKSWDQKIEVSIAKKELSFVDQPQAYRLQENQLSHVKDALKSEAQSQMVPSDSVSDVVNFDSAVFESYPGEEGGNVTLSGIDLGSDAVAENYSLKNSSITVAVDAVQQVASDKADGLSITGKKGAGAGNQVVSIPQGADAEEVWVATEPAAQWSGYKVALSLADREGGDSQYGDSANLEATAKGTYSNQLLYAQNDDGVITKVTGISYRLDPDAPRVKSFSTTQQPKSIFSGNWFFHDKADVNVAVTDEIGVDQFNQDVAQPGVSGLTADGAKITYKDDHGNASHEETNFNVDGSNGTFQFTIDGDQDVATKSFDATVTDNAGNTMNANTKDALQIPDDVMRLVADAAAPELSMTFDNMDVTNGKYYKAPRTATITIKEAHFNYIQQYDPSQAIVKIVENGQARYLTPDSFKNVASDTWQTTVKFANNSDYEVYAQVTDLVGKSSGVKSDKFTVDTVAPALSVSFDNENSANGMYFNAARTATVTVVEHNFDEGLFNIAPTSNGGNGTEVGSASVSGWTNYGDTHIARVTFPGQGVYSMNITGQDLATNQATAYTCPEFVVDTIKPEISISVGGQADASAHAYANDAAIEVSVDDTNVSAATTIDLQGIGLGTSTEAYAQGRSDSATKITVTAASPEEKPECDGVYRLNVNAVDMAGNTETKTVDWSVNRFGSTFVLSDSTKGMVDAKYLNSKDLSDVAVTEINPSGVSADSVSVQVAKGTVNSVLTNGSDYTFGSAGDQNGWPAYSYVISKNNYQPGSMYQTVLHSQDSAGHTAENTMASKNEDRSASADIMFAVDDTAPIVSFTGFDEGVVADTSHTVNVHIEDNLKLESAEIQVNGTKVKDLTAEDLATADHEIVLGESGSDQQVRVVAYDAAKNEVTADSASIFVNSDPIARWMHNTVLFVVSILLVVALLGVGGWAGYRYLAKRREEE